MLSRQKIWVQITVQPEDILENKLNVVQLLFNTQECVSTTSLLRMVTQSALAIESVQQVYRVLLLCHGVSNRA